MRALVVLDGDPLGTDTWLAKLAKAADVVIAADGGANALARAGRRPDLVIGDMDALSADLRAEGIQPTMFDCLFLPRDEGFLLSSSAGLDGFGLSVAFDTSCFRIVYRS